MGAILEAMNSMQAAENLDVIARVQSMVEYIEVFVLSVYCAHLYHMAFADNARLRQGFDTFFVEPLNEWIFPISVLLVALLSGLIAWHWLFKHDKSEA